MSDSSVRAALQDAAVPSPASAPPRPRRSFAAKRSFDIVVTILLVAILSPLFLLISFLIKLSNRHVPVLFGHEVVGRDGRTFRMWKFSTMVPDAHLVLKELLATDPDLRQEWERDVKLRHDPRILPGIARFLRGSSLNELPQLFNVLMGDMSLVGPRPITKDEEQLYLQFGGADMLKTRHAQRPGITGLWQTTGRSDVSYEERVGIDADYLRRQSLAFDIEILIRTVLKVVSRQGAV